MPDHDEITESPPIVARPLDLSHATPALWKALAEAQAAAHTVGKDGRNRDAGYNYATADSMIRGGARARKEAGARLALVSTWSQIDLAPPPGAGTPNGPGQWPSAEVTLHWALGCADDGGYISGTLSTHAIGSRRRPPDKATAAAATYAEGFVERSLMRLDRAEESDDDVDRRAEVDTSTAAEAGRDLSFQAGQGKPATRGGKPAAKRETKAQEEQRKIAELRANTRALYESLGGKSWKAWSAVCNEAKTGPQGAGTLAGLLAIDTYLAAEVAKLAERDPENAAPQTTVEREPGADDEDPGDGMNDDGPLEGEIDPDLGDR